MLGLVSTWMGNCGHVNHLGSTQVDSAFYPPWHGKRSIRLSAFRQSSNKWSWWIVTIAAYRWIYWLRLISFVQRSAAAWRCVLHLSYEPGELLQWQCHDNSTVNIVIGIIIAIIITTHGSNDSIVFGNVTKYFIWSCVNTIMLTNSWTYAWWNFARTCISTTYRTLLNIKVIDQGQGHMGFLYVSCLHATAWTSWPEFTKS